MTAAGFFKLYGVALITFFAMDLLWLGVVARGFYQTQMGHLMNPSVNWAAAVAFYLLFVVGLVRREFEVNDGAADDPVNLLGVLGHVLKHPFLAVLTSGNDLSEAGHEREPGIGCHGIADVVGINEIIGIPVGVISVLPQKIANLGSRLALFAAGLIAGTYAFDALGLGFLAALDAVAAVLDVLADGELVPVVGLDVPETRLFGELGREAAVLRASLGMGRAGQKRQTAGQAR